MNKRKAFLTTLLFPLALTAAAKDVNVNSLNVKTDGRTLNTAVLQRAIDECARTGGGRVIFAPGKYLSGELQLRSHVTLHLEKGAELQGSVHYTRDYPDRAFIYARNAEDIGISGQGTINGNGGHPDVKAQGFVVNDSKRPNLITFTDCQNVRVTDVNLIESGSWTLRLFRVDGAVIDRISLRSLDQGNNDGIDVDARNVIISNCIIEAEDDGICLKSDDKDFMPENIVVTNCIIASNCNPIKFGTASYAGFRNVNISNCAIRRTTESIIWNWPREYRGISESTITGLAGIAIESADGGVIEHINIQNITMEGIITPIFICLNHRHGDTGRIRDIYINNVSARAEGVIPCLITGSNRRHISDIVLRDIRVEHQGGEQPFDERLGESNGYPENRMFGHRNPAGGLYVRHAERVIIDNFTISQRQRDFRPAVVLDDVHHLTATGVTSRGNQSPLVKTQGEVTDASVNGTHYLTEAVGFDWQPGPSNQPVGTARGIYPGRVVMARDADACRWAGRWQLNEDQWWLDKNTDVDRVEHLVSFTLQQLTGAHSDRQAWQKIFAYYNQQHSGRSHGYKRGEVVAVKINLNNSGANKQDNLCDATPQTVLAMVRQLVREAGVPERNVVVYDVKRQIYPMILNEVWREFPDVRFLQDGEARREQPVNPKYGDHTGIEAAQWVEGISYSIDGYNEAKLMAQQIVDADYIVNLAMLKLHSYPYNYMEDGDEGQTAVTMTSKNHAGSIRGTHELHHMLNTKQGGTKNAYSPFVDLEASPNLGAKTILYMLDGLYCGRKWRSYPLHFPHAPFNNRVEPYENPEWPASIFASLDGVALQSVGLDVMYAQSQDNFETGYDRVPRIRVRDNADDFLREEADPEHAPSGTRYMQNGRPVTSLGVFEHWDSPETMRYSRNLDPKNGRGIEFLHYDLTGLPTK